MSDNKRVRDEPAWLLHHRPFRDTSRILDLITRRHGRLTVIARGSRGAKSRLRGILRPFQPLTVSWVSRTELGTLTGAEPAGRPINLDGDALLSGYYVNELLINLIHRFDPQPEVFDLYSATIEDLGAASDVTPRLRLFEMELLRLSGYALVLDHDGGAGEVLDSGKCYEYRPEEGPVAVGEREGRMVFRGSELIGIRRRVLDEPAVLDAANRLLRGVIAYHLNGKELKSRKVLREIRRIEASND